MMNVALIDAMYHEAIFIFMMIAVIGIMIAVIGISMEMVFRDDSSKSRCGKNHSVTNN